MSQLNFFKYWFKGLNRYLKSAKDYEAEKLLTYCAEACSKSLTQKIYKEAFTQYDTLKESLLFLKNKLDDFSYEIEDHCITIIYSRCGCDLYTAELVDSEKLCICSEKSLLYNWEYIYGKGSVLVNRKESFLHGDEQCRFTVKVKALGHF